MARLWLLAVVVCELLLPLQSMRISRGTAGELQSSWHPDDADVTAVAYAYDANLLACKTAGDNEKLIIQAKDAPFLDYEVSRHEFKLSCKTFTLPPKPSAVLSSLNSHSLPQDVIGVIAGFNHDVHCKQCGLFRFNMTYFERCRTALALKQWATVSREVREEGGSCDPSIISITENQTVQTCMSRHSQGDQLLICRMESLSADKIQAIESRIKENEDTIQARQELTEEKNLEHQKFMKESQELTEKNLENIKDLRHDLDMQQQNIAYLKQIFSEGP